MARLTEQPLYETVEEYRDSRVEEATRQMRKLDPEELEAELGGYAAGLASRATASSER